MAKTVTLAQLRLRAQRRADMENSQFVGSSGGNTEWNDLINAAADELYDILTTVYEDYYAASSTFTSSAGVNSYALPSDFYKLLGLDQGTGSNVITCEPYEFAERNHYTAYNEAGQTFTVQYIPCRPLLANDSDTFDGINGWEEYIVIDAAIKALTKEESDVSTLMAAKAAILKRIEDSAPNRDAGMGGMVSDIHRIDPYFGMTSPAPARYRIMGGNIVLRSLLVPLGYA